VARANAERIDISRCRVEVRKRQRQSTTAQPSRLQQHEAHAPAPLTPRR
jgi:hypothetical protein